MKPTTAPTPTCNLAIGQKKYWRVICNNAGQPIRHDGYIMLLPEQVKNYSRSLGCTLMRHLPASLK